MDSHSHSHWLKDTLQEHEGKLLRYARSLVGDLDRARDVVQETFLRLVQQSPAALDGRVTPWLFRVCRNLIIDGQRKEQRMMQVAMDAPAKTAPSPHQALEADDLTRFVLDMVAQLPANQREVVRLKFQEGMSYKDIAEVTGHSVSNVGFLIHTAVNALRSRMQQEVSS